MELRRTGSGQVLLVLPLKCGTSQLLHLHFLSYCLSLSPVVLFLDLFQEKLLSSYLVLFKLHISICTMYSVDKLGGGGVRWPRFFDHLTYVRVSWSNGQKFLTMTMAKIFKFPWSNGQNWSFLTMTMAKIPELPWSNGQNLSNLTIDHGEFQVAMVMVNFFDHWPWGKFQGVMVMVSALPPLVIHFLLR